MDALAFNYSILDTGVQGEVRQYARRLGELAQQVAVDLWEMGHILSDAQERLAACGTGTFLHWVETETSVKRSTCYRLINIYCAFDFPTVGKTALTTSVLYLLAEPSTPKEARDEALWRAGRGESITKDKAQEIVDQYRPLKLPRPPLPPLPPIPPRPPSPEYRDFERDELLPQLHDAGVADAPQMLSGQRGELLPVPEERKEQAKESLRSAIISVVRGIDTENTESLETCATEILDILGQGANSISVAAHIGVALSKGPLTLADLVELSVVVCGGRVKEMPRDEYLDQRKKVLRLIDGLSLAGCGVYEHKLENGQLVFGLMPCGNT